MKAELRRIDAFELWCWRRLESPLDHKEIQPVHPKGNQSGIFIGRTDVEAETPILWPPDAKSWLIWKDPDSGKDWGQEEKGTTEDEMVGWHHQFNGHGFGWTPGVGDGQGGLACCGLWGCKELDTTERLDWTELIYVLTAPGLLVAALIIFIINSCSMWDLVPRSGIKLSPPALRAQSLSHWTTREVPRYRF